jgi:16S rRNA (cytosine967-C5)-methyltransferase
MTLRRPRAKPAAGLAPRRAALDILSLVREGAPLDEALSECRSFNALQGSDRAFARALAAIVLRRQGTLDALLAPYLETPLPRRAQKATDALRLAAAQTALMDVADHAAVDTAVALARDFHETAGYSGLVNAVARKIAKKGKDRAQEFPERTDTPGWMWRAWERAYGADTARAIARAHREEPPLDLTARSDAAAAELAACLSGELLPTGSIRLESTRDIAALPGFAEGEWWVQDAAAALPAKLLGDVNGKRVLDLCAAPGGKTLQLASAGARVIAIDRAGVRLKLVAENLARAKLSAETVKADIFEWAPAGLADAVLLDAPCSATGVIRRNPDILRSKSEDVVAALAKVQAKLIDRAIGFVRPGGLIVYSTCSLQPEEGEAQIAAALARHANLRRIPITPEEIGGEPRFLTKHGDLRTLPAYWSNRGGIDGFFAARVRVS